MAGLDYLSRQRQALAEAVLHEAADGVGARSFKLAEHLAAEGGVHRGDVLTATAALLSMAAWCDGEPEAARRFASLASEQDEDSRELVTHLLRLEIGAGQGWLPESEREALVAYARRVRRRDLERRIRSLDTRPGGRHRRD